MHVSRFQRQTWKRKKTKGQFIMIISLSSVIPKVYPMLNNKIVVAHQLPSQQKEIRHLPPNDNKCLCLSVQTTCESSLYDTVLKCNGNGRQ